MVIKKMQLDAEESTPASDRTYWFHSRIAIGNYLSIYTVKTLKGVLSKNLQKPYICGREGLGATDDRGGYHLSRCHTPLGRVLQVFINKAF